MSKHSAGDGITSKHSDGDKELNLRVKHSDRDGKWDKELDLLNHPKVQLTIARMHVLIFLA